MRVVAQQFLRFRATRPCLESQACYSYCAAFLSRASFCSGHWASRSVIHVPGLFSSKYRILFNIRVDFTPSLQRLIQALIFRVASASMFIFSSLPCSKHRAPHLFFHVSSPFLSEQMIAMALIRISIKYSMLLA